MDSMLGDGSQVGRNGWSTHWRYETVAAKIANMRPDEQTDVEPSANLRTSQAEAAELLNVSVRNAAAAAKVKDEGAPELVAAVEASRAPDSSGQWCANG
jgi:hypothetical protein